MVAQRSSFSGRIRRKPRTRGGVRGFQDGLLGEGGVGRQADVWSAHGEQDTGQPRPTQVTACNKVYPAAPELALWGHGLIRLARINGGVYAEPC